MLMDKVDITMTAVLRPSILDQSLSTIVKNVVDDQDRFKLIINIDPIGEDVDPMVMVKVSQSHFKTVVYNIPKEPSFPKAVKWVWMNSDAPYVFHWEDDVSIFRPISIEHMIEIHKKFTDVAALRLFIKDTPNSKEMSVFRTIWRYNKNGLYIADDWKGQFGLNPNLIKREFINEAVHVLRDDINPEKVFRSVYSWAVPLISKWKYALYTNPGDKILVSGIGSEGHVWKRKLGLSKTPGQQFLTWAGGSIRETEKDSSDEKKVVLAMGAHFDDVEVGVAGTLIKHLEKGHTVYIAILESDESRTGDPKIRRNEQMAALGNMGIPKKFLLLFSYGEKDADVVAKLDDINPDVIYTLYEKDTHQAHRRCSIIGQSVGRKTHITTVFYNAGSSYDFHPNVFNIIDFDAKTKLINCFTTQIDCGALQLNAIKKKEAYWGSLVSNDQECYAEGLIVRRMIYNGY